MWSGTPVLLPRAGAPPDGRVRALRGALVLGRDRNCDVVLLEPTISRQHARLTFDGERLRVTDLGSSVGTFVNGERVAERELALGDRLKLGQAEFEVALETTGGTQPLELALLRSRPEESVRQLQTLLEVSRALAGATDLERVLATVLEAAARLLEVDRARIVLLGEDGEPAGYSCFPPGLEAGDAGERSALLRRAIDTRTTLVWDPQQGRSESMDARGALEAAASPLLVARRPLAAEREASFVGRVEVLGGILLERTRLARGFDRSQLSVLESLAADAAAAIDGARLYQEARDKAKFEHEMAIARTLQRALLQAPPPVRFAETFAYFDPASSVGGDLYHGALRSDGALALALGDVSGKGIGAALWMALAQGLLGLLHDLAHPLEDLLPELNRALVRHNPNNRFLTLGLVLIAPDGRTRWANAGHCAGIHLRPGRAPELLPSTGPVLGLLPATGAGGGALPAPRWAVRELALEPGDRIVFYSDGVTESISPAGLELEVEGLVAALADGAGESAEAAGRRLLEAAAAHRAGGEAGDDVTVLAVRYFGS
jgi:serine phosphatase RsbU (regulator of sigma subunit)